MLKTSRWYILRVVSRMKLIWGPGSQRFCMHEKKNPWLVENMEVSGRVDLVKYLSNDQSDKSWEVSGYNI